MKLKNIQVTFTEEELDEIKLVKQTTTWHDWILEMARKHNVSI